MGLMRTTVGSPVGEGARLVEDDGVHTARGLERRAAPDEDARLGGPPGADHDRGGCRETHGAWARDDEDGDRGDDGIRQRRLGSEREPGRERDGGQDEHEGHEAGADGVRQARDGRLGPLRGLDHAHDLGEDRVTADPRGAHDEAAAAIEGRADDRVVDRAQDGHRLAREHRLIDARGALDQDSVHGDGLPGADPQQVSGSHIGDRHIDLDRRGRARLPVDAVRDGRLERHQRPHGADRARSGRAPPASDP